MCVCVYVLTDVCVVTAFLLNCTFSYTLHNLKFAVELFKRKIDEVDFCCDSRMLFPFFFFLSIFLKFQKNAPDVQRLEIHTNLCSYNLIKCSFILIFSSLFCWLFSKPFRPPDDVLCFYFITTFNFSIEVS